MVFMVKWQRRRPRNIATCQPTDSNAIDGEKLKLERLPSTRSHGHRPRHPTQRPETYLAFRYPSVQERIRLSCGALEKLVHILDMQSNDPG
jgi:hypothetical protein